MRRSCVLALLLALAVSSAPADIGLVADLDGNYQNGPDTLQIDPGDTVLVHVWITGEGDSLVGFGITVGDTSGALVWVEEEGESVYTTPSGWSNVPIPANPAGWVLLQGQDFTHSVPLILPSQVAELKFTVAQGESCGTLGWDPEMSGWQNWKFLEGTFLSFDGPYCAGAQQGDGQIPGSGGDEGSGESGGPDGVGAPPNPGGLINVEAVTDATDGWAANPLWSPDGSRIAFRYEGGIGVVQIGTPGQIKRYPVGPVNPIGFCWSYDGASLYLKQKDHYREPLPVIVHRLSRIDLSSGTLLTFAGPTQRGAFPHAFEGGVAFRDSALGGAVLLQEDGTLSSAEYLFPYTGEDENLYVASKAGVSRITADGSEARYYWPSLSRGGDRIVFCSFTKGIGVVNVDGSDLRILYGGSDGSAPSWHPGGAWVLFERTVDGERDVIASDLYMVSCASGEIRRLTDSTDKIELNASFSPDGSKLAFQSKGVIYVGEVVE